jgi:hypothetical protein
MNVVLFVCTYATTAAVIKYFFVVATAENFSWCACAVEHRARPEQGTILAHLREQKQESAAYKRLSSSRLQQIHISIFL